MGNRFEGKIAVVTGGASGIGRRTAEALLEQGARVVIGDRNEAALAECAKTLDPTRCSTARVDVTVEDDVRGLVEAAVERFGRLDIGINAAGIGTLSAIRDHALDSWRSVVDVCLTGVFLALKHEVRQMVEQGAGGAVVNIASINARQPAEGMSAYCSAKAGVEMLTKVAALEVALGWYTRQRRLARIRGHPYDRTHSPGGPGAFHRLDPHRAGGQPRRHCPRRSLPRRR